MIGLTLKKLTDISVLRCKRWHGRKGVHDWTPTDWSNATAGEVGEVCNATKKLLRFDHKMRSQRDPKKRSKIIDMIAEEIADVICYIVLLAARLDIDVEAAVIKKFNKVSRREGFPERL